MPILVELTLKMEQQRTLSIQHKFGENNDTARKVYVTEKQSRKFKLTLS
jgi:hypothetical protein